MEFVKATRVLTDEDRAYDAARDHFRSLLNGAAEKALWYEKEIERLRVALAASKEKLVIYREERGPAAAYTGGMEYTELMRLIDTALGTTVA